MEQTIRTRYPSYPIQIRKGIPFKHRNISKSKLLRAPAGSIPPRGRRPVSRTSAPKRAPRGSSQKWETCVPPGSKQQPPPPQKKKEPPQKKNEQKNPPPQKKKKEPPPPKKEKKERNIRTDLGRFSGLRFENISTLELWRHQHERKGVFFETAGRLDQTFSHRIA